MRLSVRVRLLGGLFGRRPGGEEAADDDGERDASDLGGSLARHGMTSAPPVGMRQFGNYQPALSLELRVRERSMCVSSADEAVADICADFLGRPVNFWSWQERHITGTSIFEQ